MSRLGEWMFRQLLRVYPREFRDRYRDDLVAFFRQDRTHAKYGAGPLRVARFWTATLRDLVRSAWAERRTARRHDVGTARPSRSAWPSRLRADLRFAWRGLWSAPGVTLSALAVLTLGIGATTAIYSVVDAVALRGLPFPEDDRLMSVLETDLPTQRPTTVAPQNYDEWRARQDVFEGIGASAGGPRLTTKDLPIESLRNVRITASLFDVLRVAPALGRRFDDADERTGAAPVAIISDRLWRRRFAADRGAIGRPLVVEGAVYDVVGVMPPGFTYPIGSITAGLADVWTPFVSTPAFKQRDGGRTYLLSVVGRLRPGVTQADALARMTQIRDALAVEHPRWFVDHGVTVRRLQDAIVGPVVRSWMLLLLGAVTGVLLIACLNVANLLVARAMARGRELAVRSALGASRWDISRALVVESVLLSLLGTVGGVLLALWGVELLRASLPENVPRVAMVAVDFRVLGAAAGAAILTGVLFGTLPAWQFSRPDIAVLLGRGGRTSAGSGGTRGLRTGLVMAEIALAVVLLAGSALFLASFVRVLRIDMGLDPTHVASFTLAPPVINPSLIKPSATADERTSLGVAHARVTATLDRIRAVPGVAAVSALTGGVPLSGSGMTVPVALPHDASTFTGADEAWVHGVGPGYLDVMRATLTSGRWITDRDVDGAPAVVVLSDVASQRYFGARDPIGQTISLDGTPRVVVGVVRGLRLRGPESDVHLEAYIPYLQTTQDSAELLVRTTPDPATLAPAIQAAIREVVPSATLREPQTLERYFATHIAHRKFNMMVLALFGALAVAISAVGVYGLMAFLVAQRTREIGVRVALGAVPAGIIGMVLGRATRLMLGGLVVGLGAAAALEQFVRAFLFNARAYDPIVYGAVALVLLATGLVAALGPARRAARVDPLVALRAD